MAECFGVEKEIRHRIDLDFPDLNDDLLDDRDNEFPRSNFAEINTENALARVNSLGSTFAHDSVSSDFERLSLLRVFRVRDSIKSKNKSKSSAERIQSLYRTSRFRMAESQYKASIVLATQWLGRLLQVPQYAARLIAESMILGPMPKGFPLALYTYQGKQIISFAEDLTLESRRYYALRCALSAQPLLARSGRSTLKAFRRASSCTPKKTKAAPTLLLSKRRTIKNSPQHHCTFTV